MAGAACYVFAALIISLSVDVNGLKPSRCYREKDSGPCEGHHRRWYYNRDTNWCEEFIYGGCGGNDNTFFTLAECQEDCLDGDTCFLPPGPGPCRGRFRRWFFDSTTGTCEPFIYGGCEGNGNNFERLLDCIESCAGRSCSNIPCGNVPNARMCDVGYTCNEHPNAEYSICCEASVCQPGVPVSNCKIDPCKHASCPAFRTAECKADYCGRCAARFYLREFQEVTDRCYNIPQLTNRYAPPGPHTTHHVPPVPQAAPPVPQCQTGSKLDATCHSGSPCPNIPGVIVQCQTAPGRNVGACCIVGKEQPPPPPQNVHVQRRPRLTPSQPVPPRSPVAPRSPVPLCPMGTRQMVNTVCGVERGNCPEVPGKIVECYTRPEDGVGTCCIVGNEKHNTWTYTNPNPVPPPVVKCPPGTSKSDNEQCGGFNGAKCPRVPGLRVECLGPPGSGFGACCIMGAEKPSTPQLPPTPQDCPGGRKLERVKCGGFINAKCPSVAGHFVECKTTLGNTFGSCCVTEKVKTIPAIPESKPVKKDVRECPVGSMKMEHVRCGRFAGVACPSVPNAKVDCHHLPGFDFGNCCVTPKKSKPPKPKPKCSPGSVKMDQVTCGGYMDRRCPSIPGANTECIRGLGNNVGMCCISQDSNPAPPQPKPVPPVPRCPMGSKVLDNTKCGGSVNAQCPHLQGFRVECHWLPNDKFGSCCVMGPEPKPTTTPKPKPLPPVRICPSGSTKIDNTRCGGFVGAECPHVPGYIVECYGLPKDNFGSCCIMGPEKKPEPKPPKPRPKQISRCPGDKKAIDNVKCGGFLKASCPRMDGFRVKCFGLPGEQFGSCCIMGPERQPKSPQKAVPPLSACPEGSQKMDNTPCGGPFQTKCPSIQGYIVACYGFPGKSISDCCIMGPSKPKVNRNINNHNNPHNHNNQNNLNKFNKNDRIDKANGINNRNNGPPPTTGGKVGQCPILNRQGPCGQPCEADYSCPHFQKCCSNSCGRVCVEPVFVNKKPGICPGAVGIGRCSETCKSDFHCPGAQKCCHNGCALDCLDPGQNNPFLSMFSFF